MKQAIVERFGGRTKPTETRPPPGPANPSSLYDQSGRLIVRSNHRTIVVG